MTLAAMRDQLHVLDRVHAVGHRPQQGVRIIDIDVVVDRDADLAAIAFEESGAIERTPDLGTRRALLHRNDGDAQQAGQRFVQRDFLDALNAERIAQMRREQRLVGDALDDTGFAWRHLTDVGRDHRLLAVRDRGNAHRHVELFERDVAVRLAERRLRLEIDGVDQTFDDQFGFRRDHQVDGAALRDVDRTAGQAARHGDFIDADGQFLRTHEGDVRRTAEHDGAGHGFAHLLVFQIVLIAAGAADARRHAHDKTIR